MREHKGKVKNIAILGLGYVGLPLAVAFDKAGFFVIGFDISKKKIAQLKKNIDPAGEVDKRTLSKSKVYFTDNPKNIRKADFVIAAIPTPINKSNRPDLTLLKKASKSIGKNLRPGQIVVFESTVYPGVTEDICAPIIEKYSDLECGKDFKIGYSPERMNPGDKKNTVKTIVKVVSGIDKDSLQKIAKLYSAVCKAGVHKASSIKVAEASKVIENIQRDLNIALINELAQIFHKVGIDTNEVLEAAGTKWNFHKYHPGLVGGHCIGVDPFYLTHLAQKLKYNPQVILSGRKTNDNMAKYVASLMIKELKNTGKKLSQSKVLVMGLTFKENVNDTRNSKTFDVIQALQKNKIKVLTYDPWVLPDNPAYKKVSCIHIDKFESAKKIDGIIICIAHDKFKKLKLKDFRKITNNNAAIIDVTGKFKKVFQDSNYIYKRL